MKMNKMLITILAVAVIVAIASMIASNRKAERVVKSEQPRPLAAAPAPVVSNPTPLVEAVPLQIKPQIQPSNASVPARKAPQKVADQTGQPLMINGYEVQDPAARAALSLAGSDPDADAYWAGAINDPNLPSEERKDLIEDLNEDGLSDPRHPGPQDIPLIVARIRLIEEMAPDAMDQVNADAFAEAYKDLVGMLNGQPPQ